jgi:hypothetical protein
MFRLHSSKNITLWWWCPWTLAAYVTQVGSLAIVVFGLCYLITGRTSGPATASERPALTLCLWGFKGMHCALPRGHGIGHQTDHPSLESVKQFSAAHVLGRVPF